MTDQHWVVKLSENLPCGIRKGDVTCDNPAAVAQVWADGRVRGGELVMLPICRECTQQMAGVYLADEGSEKTENPNRKEAKR